MGCGCGKKSSTPRTAKLRPSVGPRPIQGGGGAGATPSEIRALGVQKKMEKVPSVKPKVPSVRQMSAQRLLLEKKRREAVKKRLGK
jgi:hypothetical protein